MTRISSLIALLVLLLATRQGGAIQTGRVELGLNGAYDGTVYITRSSTGSLVFCDNETGSSVSLQQLLQVRADHGSLAGLGDDDHPQYLNSARHWQAHTAGFDDEMPIPPDVDGNVTLGGHIGDTNIHIRRNAAETIAGSWRFTGTPVFAPFLRLEAADTYDPAIDFGTGYPMPRISYLSALEEFEFSRPIRATSGSLTDLESSRLRVLTSIDGLGLNGEPSAVLTNFASINGIGADDLLDRGANEDIAGQWDFLELARFFGDVAVSGDTWAKCGLRVGDEGDEPSTGDIVASDGVRTLRWDADGGVGNGQLTFPYGPYIKIQNTDGRLEIGEGAAGKPLDLRFKYVRTYAEANDGYFAVCDGSGAPRFQAFGNGGIVLSGNLVLSGSDKKVTIGDGASDAPFIYTFNAASAYYPDSRETLAPTSRSLTGLEYAGFGTSYVAFPVPNDVLGANVVIDRITVCCSQQGGNGVQIGSIALVDDTNTAVRSYSGIITTDTQWLSSDYTMEDEKSYVIRMEFQQGSAGYLRVTSFKVEYHLE